MRLGASGLLVLALGLVSAVGHAQSLLEFYRHALQTNPALRTREFGVDQAKAQQDLAGSRLLPQVVITGNYYLNDYRESGSEAKYYDGKRAAVQARQALLDLASYFKLQGAKFSVTQSEHQREAARMGLGGDVVDRYLMVLQAADEIRHLQAEKETVEGELKRLRFMHERGLVKVTDLFQAEAYYQGLLTREIDARNGRAVALEQLREISGMAAQDVAPLARERFPAVPGREAQWVDDAAQNNPNLVALKKGIEAARMAIKSGESEHVPQLALTATRTYSDQGYDNRLTPSYSVATVGLQLTIPLYEGGRVAATVHEATARYEIAREQLEGARREIERFARTAYLNAVASYARIGSTNEEVRAMEKVLDAQKKYYTLGVATVVDVLNAQRFLFKARSDQSKARYDYIRHLTILRVRAGALSMHDIEQIDGWMERNVRAAPSNTIVPAAPRDKIDHTTSAVTNLLMGATFKAIDPAAPPGLVEPAAAKGGEPAVSAAGTAPKLARPFAVLEAPPSLAMVAPEASSAVTESVAMELPGDF